MTWGCQKRQIYDGANLPIRQKLCLVLYLNIILQIIIENSNDNASSSMECGICRSILIASFMKAEDNKILVDICFC